MKIKEKILKLGKRKNCFIALLMAILLAFAVLGGLNGSKSAQIKADALINEPQEKNLDLNGIRYKYKTSLNELKNDYKLFNHVNYELLFNISMNQENSVTFNLKGVQDNVDVSTSEMNVYLSKTKSAITFYDVDNNIVENNDYTIAPSEPYNTSTLIFDYPSSYNLNDFYDIEISFIELLSNLPYIDDEYFGANGGIYGNNGFFIGFAYLSDELETGNVNYDYLYSKSKFFGFQFNKIVNTINLEIPRYEGYTLRQIFCTFTDEELNLKNKISGMQPAEFSNNNFDFTPKIIFINNIRYYYNLYNTSYGIGFEYDFEKDEGVNIYKGNLLLSESEYDKNLINDVSSLSNPTEEPATVQLKGAYFGGKFKEVNYQSYSNMQFTLSDGLNPLRNIIYGKTRPNYYGFYINNTIGKVTYFEQNQLLYLEDINTLRGTFNNREYSALSSQVEDVLYNVNYVGNVEEIERNERIEEDLQNLAKTTGLGAFIGLIIGILIGNPVLGLVIGALWGFIVGIFPLLIDGLQAIFGNNFLSGVYNFFKSITNFFVNIVDTIFNFISSIITNPFILILIVIIAIIYLVKRYGNK